MKSGRVRADPVFRDPFLLVNLVIQFFAWLKISNFVIGKRTTAVAAADALLTLGLFSAVTETNLFE